MRTLTIDGLSNEEQDAIEKTATLFRDRAEWEGEAKKHADTIARIVLALGQKSDWADAEDADRIVAEVARVVAELRRRGPWPPTTTLSPATEVAAYLVDGDTREELIVELRQSLANERSLRVRAERAANMSHADANQYQLDRTVAQRDIEIERLRGGLEATRKNLEQRTVQRDATMAQRDSLNELFRRAAEERQAAKEALAEEVAAHNRTRDELKAEVHAHGGTLMKLHDTERVLADRTRERDDAAAKNAEVAKGQAPELAQLRKRKALGEAHVNELEEALSRFRSSVSARAKLIVEALGDDQEISSGREAALRHASALLGPEESVRDVADLAGDSDAITRRFVKLEVQMGEVLSTLSELYTPGSDAEVVDLAELSERLDAQGTAIGKTLTVHGDEIASLRGRVSLLASTCAELAKRPF